jgi:hypothetical protein
MSSQVDCYSLSFKAQLKSLLSNSDSPLRSRALIDEPKAYLLVKVPRGIETLKGTKKDAAIYLGATEVDGSVDKSSSNTFPAQTIGHYEPPKMRAGVSTVRTVNGDGALDSPRHGGNPEPIAKFVIVAEELREPSCDLRFKQHSESPVGVIVAGV